MLGAIIILTAMCLGVVVTEAIISYKDRKRIINLYIEKLEKEIMQQKRALAAYRFNELQRSLDDEKNTMR